MQFFNKWYLIILILVIAGVYYYASSSIILCWDGVGMDEEILMQNCGVTPQQYHQERRADPSFCPAGQKAMYPMGGCGPEWGAVALFVIGASVIYNSLYIVIYFILKKRER